MILKVIKILQEYCYIVVRKQKRKGKGLSLNIYYLTLDDPQPILVYTPKKHDKETGNEVIFLRVFLRDGLGRPLIYLVYWYSSSIKEPIDWSHPPRRRRKRAT